MYNRISSIRKNIDSFNNSDELRKEILNVLNTVHDVPKVGNYYTFLHLPKKKILYDQHPLVATMNLKEWGFGGLNFHSKKIQNYNWNSVKGKYHLVRKSELEDLIEIKFGKRRLNR